MLKIAFALILLIAAAFADEEEVIIRPRLDGKIVGGSTATIQQFPYIVSLRVTNSHICGASIISSTWIVSAAHCTISYSASLLSIRSGSALSNSGGTISNVAQVINHPQYNSRTINNDISLLRVASLALGATRAAVGLIAAGRELSAGTYATVSGWGATRESGSGSTQLLRVDVPIVSHAACNSAYGGITAAMLCAGYTAGGRDACQGDSGGPLVSGGVLVGVVSWGNGCARPNFPGVYAKVSNLRSFISSNTGI